jgi:hypothetical protein
MQVAGLPDMFEKQTPPQRSIELEVIREWGLQLILIAAVSALPVLLATVAWWLVNVAF